MYRMAFSICVVAFTATSMHVAVNWLESRYLILFVAPQFAVYAVVAAYAFICKGSGLASTIICLMALIVAALGVAIVRPNASFRLYGLDAQFLVALFGCFM